MGFEVALAVGVIAGGVLIYTMSRNRPNQDQMQPQGLDSFGLTRSAEGQVAPMVWGKVRLSTNLLWYGNLVSEPVYQESGGKGFMMGGGKVVQGYKYWLDLWHELCEGPNVTLNKVYIQDREREITELPVDSYTFNPGDTNDFPTEPGQYASPMKPLATIFLKKYLLGVNVTNVPTLHFVLTRTSSAPLTYANETTGVNPAAVIYDLLIASGVTTAMIDFASFEDACTYWHGKGYGLNLILDRQEDVEVHINRILTYVDASLLDDGQKFYLKAWKDTDTASASITTEKFKEFTFARRGWDDVYSDFRANFTDDQADFSQRTIRMRNPAVRYLLGHDNQISIDLTAYRQEAARTRLWDTMKKMSYPEAQIQCTVGIEYWAVQKGDVVSITNTDYDMTDQLFRVMEKEESEHDKNQIEFTMTQVLDTLLKTDETPIPVGSTKWVPTHYAAAAPVHQRVLELPYTSQYGDQPAYLCLCERATLEDGFTIRKTVTSGGDFENYADASYFSQYGVLSEEYTADTYAIDDETGIRYTPSREDPVFSSLSRAALFSSGRIAVLYNTSTGAFEIVAFQTTTPIAQTNDNRLTGVIRGLMNTTKQTWAIGTEIWLVNLGDNVMTGIKDGQFYLKFVPYIFNEEVSESSCTEMTVNYTGRAKTPWPPTLVKATRSGSTITVIVWPTTRVYSGAGVTDGAGTTHGSTSGQTDQWPPEFVGSFNYSDDSWVSTYNSTSYTWSYSNAGAHTLDVKSLVSGYQSTNVSVSVGAGDGDYYGPEE